MLPEFAGEGLTLGTHEVDMHFPSQEEAEQMAAHLQARNGVEHYVVMSYEFNFLDPRYRVVRGEKGEKA